MLAVGFAGGSTGSCRTLVDDFRMTQCGNGLLFLNDRHTNGASAALCLTGSGTGGCHALHYLSSMGGSRNCLGVAMATAAAGVSLYAFFEAGRYCCNLGIVLMSQRCRRNREGVCSITGVVPGISTAASSGTGGRGGFLVGII